MGAAPALLEADVEAATLPRLLKGLTTDLATHRQDYPAPTLFGRPVTAITTAIEQSGLRGRGGAGFPTGRKLRAVAEHRSLTRKPIVVVNGSEGEPASSKDAILLTKHPHLVLDGALLAAAAVGATDVVVCIDRNASKTLEAVRAAVAQRTTAGTEPATGIIRVAAIPHRYVAGEETALIHWLNGGEAKPTLTPPRPFESGVGGRPTLVDNVETLAHVAQIVRWGPDWFREHGTTDEPGTMLVTISGAVDQKGIHEVPVGARLGTVIRQAGGSLSNGTAQAVLVGGYFGAWLSPQQARRIRLCDADLRPLGAGLGCGAIVVLPKDACGLKETARMLAWLAGESAGQCGSCVHGLAAIAGGAANLFHGEDTVDRLLRWAGQVEGRGACHLPNGAVRLLRSGLAVFADEVDRHRSGQGCTGGAAVLPIPNTRNERWQ